MTCTTCSEAVGVWHSVEPSGNPWEGRNTQRRSPRLLGLSAGLGHCCMDL